MIRPRSNWDTHDFRVKMLDWSASRGSRLAYSCRRCGRRFCHFTLLNRDTWAIDAEGKELLDTISKRWLAEECPRQFKAKDDDDRKQSSLPAAALAS